MTTLNIKKEDRKVIETTERLKEATSKKDLLNAFYVLSKYSMFEILTHREKLPITFSANIRPDHLSKKVLVVEILDETKKINRMDIENKYRFAKNEGYDIELSYVREEIQSKFSESKYCVLITKNI